MPERTRAVPKTADRLGRMLAIVPYLVQHPGSSLDDVAASREVEAGGDWRRTGSARESASMAPDHDRPLPAVVERRRPDVQHQAVFALAGQARAGDGQIRDVASRAGLGLRCAGPEFEGVAHAVPLRDRGGRHEPVPARGVGAVGDALEDLDALDLDPAHLAGHGVADNVRVGGQRRAQAGTLTVNGNGTSNGSFEAAADATLLVGPAFNGTQTLSAASSAGGRLQRTHSAWNRRT